ncbi:MAG: hypothetical protein HQL60_07280, partial [Magnetococcales bacterium]|nr:hypothetical protein [Magnetococcales bacterium]
MNLLKIAVMFGAVVILIGFALLINNAVTGDDPVPARHRTGVPVELMVSGRVTTLVPVGNGGVTALIESGGDDGLQELWFFNRHGFLERQVRLMPQDSPSRQI